MGGQQVRVVARRGHHCQDPPGGRVEGDRRALARAVGAALLQRVPAGLLNAGQDGGVDVAAARVAAGEEVGQPTAEQPFVGPVEDGVLGPLQPGARIAQRVEARNRCVDKGIRIHPQVPEPPLGGHRVGHQLTGGGDLAPLTGVLVEQHPLIARIGPQPVGPEDLGHGGVQQQQHHQRHDGHRDATQGGVHTFSITSVRTTAMGCGVFGPVSMGRRAAWLIRMSMANST